MSAQLAPVDVLAVCKHYHFANDAPEDFCNAINAIHELIADATLALELLESEGHGDGYTAGLLRASIARAKGQS